MVTFQKAIICGAQITSKWDKSTSLFNLLQVNDMKKAINDLQLFVQSVLAQLSIISF